MATRRRTSTRCSSNWGSALIWKSSNRSTTAATWRSRRGQCSRNCCKVCWPGAVSTTGADLSRQHLDPGAQEVDVITAGAVPQAHMHAADAFVHRRVVAVVDIRSDGVVDADGELAQEQPPVARGPRQQAGIFLPGDLERAHLVVFDVQPGLVPGNTLHQFQQLFVDA